MLVVLEGLDGAGKSTQVKKLRTYLEGLFGSLEYIHFPRYDAPVYGDLISRFLRGDFGSNEQVHPQLVALLFAEDRHGAAPGMKETLNAGGHVLLDRYVYSNIAYQCSKIMMQPQFGENRREKAQELRNWIFDTEYNKYGIPRPDLNLFLDVPISFVDSKLKESRSGDDDRDYLNGKEDIHEADIQFQIYVREMYLEQTKADEGFVRVHCEDAQGNMLPPCDIFNNIKEQVDKLF